MKDFDEFSTPNPPARLKGESRKFWQRIAPILHERGTLRPEDTEALAILCEWRGRYLVASQQADAAKPDDPNLIRKFMAVSMCQKQLERLFARFGLTPGDRKKLGITNKPKAGVMTRKRL